MLNPSQQPLRIDTNELNKHFATTAERVTGSVPVNKRALQQLIDSLQPDRLSAFHFRTVTHAEVDKEIKAVRSDCSTGPDDISTKFIKLASHLRFEHLLLHTL